MISWINQIQKKGRFFWLKAPPTEVPSHEGLTSQRANAAPTVANFGSKPSLWKKITGNLGTSKSLWQVQKLGDVLTKIGLFFWCLMFDVSGFGETHLCRMLRRNDDRKLASIRRRTIIIMSLVPEIRMFLASDDETRSNQHKGRRLFLLRHEASSALGDGAVQSKNRCSMAEIRFESRNFKVDLVMWNISCRVCIARRNWHFSASLGDSSTNIKSNSRIEVGARETFQNWLNLGCQQPVIPTVVIISNCTQCWNTLFMLLKNRQWTCGRCTNFFQGGCGLCWVQCMTCQESNLLAPILIESQPSGSPVMGSRLWQWLFMSPRTHGTNTWCVLD